MHPLIARISALSLCALLLVGGCRGLTPGESASSVGVGSGLAAGLIGAAAGLRPGAAAALGAGVGLFTAGVTYAIARYQASARQRQVAERNARRAYGAHRTELRRQNVRYIAVRTTRTMQSSGGVSCMLWDTQTQQLVGNNVYDCKTAPASGSTAKFDSYSAEYVGL